MDTCCDLKGAIVSFVLFVLINGSEESVKSDSTFASDISNVDTVNENAHSLIRG